MDHGELDVRLEATDVALFDADLIGAHDLIWVGKDGSGSEQFPVDPRRVRSLSRLGCAGLDDDTVACWNDGVVETLDIEGPVVDLDGLHWYRPDPNERLQCLLLWNLSVDCFFQEDEE